MTKQALDIALVHGGFVDGSGWREVYDLLKDDGFDVTVVQNPTITLENDVATTRLSLAARGRPVMLVGHSYGGVVITEAGTHPKVAGLVYIAAFAPDKGESVSTLIKDPTTAISLISSSFSHFLPLIPQSHRPFTFKKCSVGNHCFLNV